MKKSRSTAAVREEGLASATEVSVRVLKNRLSEFLREVEIGSTFVVTSHGRPIADLVPHREGTAAAPPLVIHQATRPWGSVELPRSGRGRTDSLELLLEDRRRR
jgi:prevent-host-death family protein